MITDINSSGYTINNACIQKVAKNKEIRKETNMTTHQLQLMRARQDCLESQRQRQAERAAMTRMILEGKAD
jgi:hypothetical protein